MTANDGPLNHFDMAMELYRKVGSTVPLTVQKRFLWWRWKKVTGWLWLEHREGSLWQPERIFVQRATDRNAHNPHHYRSTAMSLGRDGKLQPHVGYATGAWEMLISMHSVHADTDDGIQRANAIYRFLCMDIERAYAQISEG